MNLNFTFVKSVFSEPDGTGSASRILITAIVCFVLGIGSALVAKIHTPVSVSDINSFLGAAGIFIASTCTPMYLINKGANTMIAKSDNEHRDHPGPAGLPGE